MSGSHRSLLVRQTGQLLISEWHGELFIFKYFFFFFLPTQPHAALILTLFVASLMCYLSGAFEVSISVFSCSISISSKCSLSCILTFFCVFLSQLSDFLSVDCSNIFPFVLFFLWIGQHHQQNPKFVRCSPSTLIPSETSAFLKISSTNSFLFLLALVLYFLFTNLLGSACSALSFNVSFAFCCNSFPFWSNISIPPSSAHFMLMDLCISFCMVSTDSFKA